MLDRYDFADGPVGEHHATRVNTQMSRKLQHFVRQFDNEGRDVVIGARDDSAPPFDLFRPGILLSGRVSERFGHIAYREFGAVGDDVSHLSCVLSAVFLVHVLDDLFSTVGVEIDVDIGFLVAHARQKTLEWQLVEDRIDRGDTEHEADSGVGGRAPALTEDAAAFRIGDDVVHDQEVAGKVFDLDHLEFAFDACAVIIGEVRVLLGDTLPDQVPQPAHRAVAVGNLLFREARFSAPQSKTEFGRELDRSLDNPRIPREPGSHLGAGTQVSGAGCGQPSVHLVEAAPGAHRGEGGGERMLGRGRVVHVAGGDGPQSAALRDLEQDVVVIAVEWTTAVDEFDDDVLGTEQVDESQNLRFGGLSRTGRGGSGGAGGGVRYT